VNSVQKLSNVASLDLINFNSLTPGKPFRGGRPVFLTRSSREFLRGQVLYDDVLKGDGHGDNSLAVDMHLPDRLRQPIANIRLPAEPPVTVKKG
jgi:hypothetical protein